ncbi:hypothetical protein J5O04_09365 [Corynebacterium hindlerae]|uniref:hypothetical protein n=1 Tax=Corynebacterium hindlerae TaxID=699041 RepID=UPI001AD653C0|nr:hypothetical protein [Corynebacterium hindlerae]QTH59012.1 hypothetical protein J5O04_09365 [Corynebacterium hindlerae]
MPRKNKRQRPELRQLPVDGSTYWGTRRQEAHGISFLVRQIGSSAARKFYICPGCNQNIPPGVAHIVAWEPGREHDRRHWHKPCWHRECA